ncbi:MAG TPA: rod shape-determining protein MreD [Streptosporangiaceae bacterium]|nr:rod shape-determining protein MreD [Streptosporangiaceae bacterium]
MRALVSLVLVAFTVVLQLTVVDRIAFPGGAGPDLVLLVVTALALAGGPMVGVLTGFLAGLALDVAPPGSHFVGQNALVFCLVGYLCGLLADTQDDAEQGHSALFEIVVVAVGAVLGETLLALLGVMLSDPRVTWPAISKVLPAAVAYDMLLCPFVLYAVASVLRLAGVRGEARRPGLSPSQARTSAPAANQGAVRQLTGGRTPRLRLSERDTGTGSIGGLRDPGSARPAARREPQLKLGRPGPRTSAGLGTAFASTAFGPGTVRIKFGGHRRDGVLGGRRGDGVLGGRRREGVVGGSFGSAGLGISRFGSSSMGRSLLGGSVFSRGPASPVTRPAVFGRPAPLGLSSSRRRGNPAGGGLAGRPSRFARGGGSLARLRTALRRSASPKSPGRGWLRGVSSRSGSLRGHTLGGASMSRRAFGRSLAGRGLAGRGLAGRGATGRGFTRRGLSSSRTPRLRMPRPRTGRRWRTGGYR